MHKSLFFKDKMLLNKYWVAIMLIFSYYFIKPYSYQALKVTQSYLSLGKIIYEYGPCLRFRNIIPTQKCSGAFWTPFRQIFRNLPKNMADYTKKSFIVVEIKIFGIFWFFFGSYDKSFGISDKSVGRSEKSFICTTGPWDIFKKSQDNFRSFSSLSI